MPTRKKSIKAANRFKKKSVDSKKFFATIYDYFIIRNTCLSMRDLSQSNDDDSKPDSRRNKAIPGLPSALLIKKLIENEIHDVETFYNGGHKFMTEVLE